jgi:hypothetical protein
MHHVLFGLWNAGAHRKRPDSEIPGAGSIQNSSASKPGMLEL